MENITKNEMLLVLNILKSPETQYNANSIAKHIGITPMGALKIAKKLERENILKSKKIGKARFYKLNLANDYARKYATFLLKRESEQAPAYVKRWVNELKKIKSAESVILFGSVLRKHEGASDIDVLFTTDKKRFPKLKKEVEDINFTNTKKLHPVYQTEDDARKNIENGDKTVLNALKGIVVFGEEKFLRLLEK